MKKSIGNLISKLKENDSKLLMEGFAVLKGVRGGALPTENSSALCSNTYTCSGTNSTSCTNSGKCGESTNSGTCTNSGSCFF